MIPESRLRHLLLCASAILAGSPGHAATMFASPAAPVINGYLPIGAPETRIITGAFSDIILAGREHGSLLAVANDLLDVLANAAREAPLRALTLENTFRPAQLLGSIIGGVIGFCLGGFTGVILLFLLKEKHLFLIPVLALAGAALGRFIGKMFAGAK